MDKKAQFYKTYANIPLGLRNQIVVVLEDKEPLSWNAAKVEVDNDTDKVNEILEKLSQTGLLSEEEGNGK